MREKSFPAEQRVKPSERYDKPINLKHLKEESALLVTTVCVSVFFWKGSNSSQ